ncbi:Uncharacterised protein [Klebsiella pneumoniae]|nr:Uncharacterised protein [Klebsiella pneumoniae]
MLSIRASGRQWSARAAVKPSSPPTSRTSTPSPSLQTSPQRACARASCQTKGRNPTPCTLPRMRICTPFIPGVTRPAPYGDVSRYSSAQVCCGQRTPGHASGRLPCRPGRSRGGSRDRTCWLRLFPPRRSVRRRYGGSPGAPPPPSPRTGRRRRRFCSRCNAPASHGQSLYRG